MRRAQYQLDVPFCGGVDQPNLELKATITEEGHIEGWGAIFSTPDGIQDIIEPGAFVKTLAKGGRNGTGVAMLHQHDIHTPVGIWEQLIEKKKGLWVSGQLALNTHAGHDDHELAKMGALRGLSIGYETVIDELDCDKKVRRIKEIELWEISLVTFPMHTGAQIATVKSSADMVEELKQILRVSKTEYELRDCLVAEGHSQADAVFLARMMKAYLGSDFLRTHNIDSDIVMNGMRNILQDLQDLRRTNRGGLRYGA